MIEVTDDLGRRVRLEAAAARIVCLVPSITETLFAFGAGDRVAGVTQFCIHPSNGVAAKPKVGGTKNISVEAVLSLAPDLVIANAEENRKNQVDRLSDAGVRVFVTFPKTIDGCLKMMRDIAALAGTEPAAAPILADIESARAEAELRGRNHRPSVLCPIWKNPFMTINRDTFVSEVIREAGGSNIYDGAAERYPKFVLEEAARSKPGSFSCPRNPIVLPSRTRQISNRSTTSLQSETGGFTSWRGSC
jgi:ABC-type Fe3+-hydroxamate transport system substrate-binding protein